MLYPSASSWESHHKRCAKAGISGPEMVLSTMAVGLVIDVWRNGPTENIHCGKRGPSDAAMFAELTSLHDQAVKTLAAGDCPIGLLEFEDHLLDRGRPWAGTGGKTLKDLAQVGQYEQCPPPGLSLRQHDPISFRCRPITSAVVCERLVGQR